jgi:hypothetical protein
MDHLGKSFQYCVSTAGLLVSPQSKTNRSTHHANLENELRGLAQDKLDTWWRMGILRTDWTCTRDGCCLLELGCF